LAELEQAITQLTASTGAPTEGEAPLDQEVADGAVSAGHIVEHESVVSDDQLDMAIQEGHAGESAAPEDPTLATHRDEPRVQAHEPKGDAIPSDSGADDLSTPIPGAGERRSAVPDLELDDEGEADQASPQDIDDATAPARAFALGQDTTSPGDPGPGGADLDNHVLDGRGGLMSRITVLRAMGCPWSAMAKLFNVEGVPTISGRGRWDGKTVARLMPIDTGQAHRHGQDIWEGPM
jgi:hypothetical protein